MVCFEKKLTILFWFTLATAGSEHNANVRYRMCAEFINQFPIMMQCITLDKCVNS